MRSRSRPRRYRYYPPTADVDGERQDEFRAVWREHKCEERVKEAWKIGEQQVREKGMFKNRLISKEVLKYLMAKKKREKKALPYSAVMRPISQYAQDSSIYRLFRDREGYLASPDCFERAKKSHEQLNSTFEYKQDLGKLLNKETAIDRMLRKDQEAMAEQKAKHDKLLKIVTKNAPTDDKPTESALVLPTKTTKAFKTWDCPKCRTTNHESRAQCHVCHCSLVKTIPKPKKKKQTKGRMEKQQTTAASSFTYQKSLHQNAVDRRKKFLGACSKDDIKDAQKWFARTHQV